MLLESKPAPILSNSTTKIHNMGDIHHPKIGGLAWGPITASILCWKTCQCGSYRTVIKAFALFPEAYTEALGKAPANRKVSSAWSSDLQGLRRHNMGDLSGTTLLWEGSVLLSHTQRPRGLRPAFLMPCMSQTRGYWMLLISQCKQYAGCLKKRV